MKFKICGQSMVPFLKDDDHVCIEPIPISHVKVGDLIAYFDKISKIMVVHRVVCKTTSGIILKGDNNFRLDKVVLTNETVFRVTQVINKKGTINLHRRVFRFVNVLLCVLSILRIIPLIFGHQIKYVKRIGGKKVDDKTYYKYTKFLKMNNNKK